jgi:hypothetical protein
MVYAVYFYLNPKTKFKRLIKHYDINGSMDWKLLTFVVCCFGFFKDLWPSEAYLTTFLTREWKNLTWDQVNNEIYPWWTYSYAIWFIPVFTFTDNFRYRSLLILDASAYIMTWVLILWAEGIPAMTVMQVSYGLATAGEIGLEHGYNNVCRLVLMFLGCIWD